MKVFGFDVSKGHSTVCLMDSGTGKMLKRPFDVRHTLDELDKFYELTKVWDDDCCVVMEATGIYHLPVLSYLVSRKIKVAAVNPFQIKKFRSQNLRAPKTDKIDSREIAKYGIANLNKIMYYRPQREEYQELRFLLAQYDHLLKIHVSARNNIVKLADLVMPGIDKLITPGADSTGKEKLADFLMRFWHAECIRKMSCKRFYEAYATWAKRKGYHPNLDKAAKIYTMVENSIPSVKDSPSVCIAVKQAVETLNQANKALMTILTQMGNLAKTLPEYTVVRSMGGVGDKLAVQLIAAIGDCCRFHSANALTAYAGVDVPPYESSEYKSTHQKITKRGSPQLRKICYLVMQSLISHVEPKDNPVYNFILRKEKEGKPKKVAKVAGINKFLKIYYIRVNKVYATRGKSDSKILLESA